VGIAKKNYQQNEVASDSCKLPPERKQQEETSSWPLYASLILNDERWKPGNGFRTR
jgi:hypothetical protein